MKTNLERLSIEDIIRKLGFFINFSDFMACYKFNGSQKQMSKFEDEMTQKIKSQKGVEEYLKTISENENLFDKELYVFHLLRILQDTYDKIQSNTYINGVVKVPIFMINGKGENVPLDRDSIKRILSKSRKLLQDSDIVDLEVYRESGKIEIYESRRYVGKNTKADADERKAEERLKKIEEEIGLENIISFLQPTDLINVCKYPNLGNLLAVKIIENGKKIKNKDTIRIQDRVNNREIETTEKLAKGKYFDWDEFIDTVRENFRYIDIDKMLLLANTIFYNKYGNEPEKFPFEEARKLREFTRKVEGLLENKNVTINSYRFNSDIDFNLIKSSVESLNKHYINGRYRDDVEINQLAKDIMDGKVSVTSLSEEEYRETMSFKPIELAQIVTSRPETLQSLIERSWITDKELEDIIDKMENINKDQVVYLYNSKKMSNEVFLENYMVGKILLEDISYLKDNIERKENLEQIVSSENLVSLFLDKDRKKEFVKYKDLYKALKISGKTAEEKQAVADEILEVSNELLNEDKMQELYKMGLIPLDTYIDFVGISAVSELYLKGELKPVDARRLYDENVLTKEMITELLTKKEVDDGKKLTLIYSTFSEKEDEYLRDEFIKYIKTTKKSSHSKGENNQRIEKENIQTGKRVSRYFTDPSARWNLMASLDSEYSFEYKSDGSAIFYLPKFRKYILEKLYNQNNEPAWGAATYILDEDIYEENEENIIEGDVINRSKLARLRGEKGVKRFIHTGWSNAICKFFDIEDTDKYTEEQINQIKKFSKQVEESKKPLERE